jgi:hypothetical protein
VLIYLAVNIAAIRAFRTEFRDQFRVWRHMVLPAAAAVLFSRGALTGIDVGEGRPVGQARRKVVLPVPKVTS